MLLKQSTFKKTCIIYQNKREEIQIIDIFISVYEKDIILMINVLNAMILSVFNVQNWVAHTANLPTFWMVHNVWYHVEMGIIQMNHKISVCHANFGCKKCYDLKNCLAC